MSAGLPGMLSGEGAVGRSVHDPRVPPVAAASASLLDAHGLQVGIGGKWVCRDLNLRVAPGEIWALLGENGVGKSTLLATLAGVRAPQQGRLALAGEVLPEMALRRRALIRAWLPQRDDDPFPATVLETVLVGRHPRLGRFDWEGEADVAAARAALEAVDLAGFEARDVATLSGGERRRVALAAILVQETPLLLLDEPLAQLDIRHQLAVLQILVREAGRGRGLVMVTHDPNHAARYATHALLLFGAGRTRSGPVGEVISAASLTELYGCPVAKTEVGGQPLYLAGTVTHPIGSATGP